MINKKNPSEFIHNNVPPLNINILLEWDKSLFTEQQFESDKNSLDIDDLTEKAAIGMILACILEFYPDITSIKVCLKGEGFDYKIRRNDYLIKLEISGVNKENKNTFNSRIYTKKNKFKESKYEPYGNEELIGIVDFYYLRYILKDVSN